MTDSTVATGLTVQNWNKKFFTESIMENRFKREMGKSTNNIIQLKTDLEKNKGDSITYALVNRLTGAGVTGSSTLEGNEEDMESRSFKLAVNKIRNAVRVADIDEQFSAISLRQAGREVLMDWNMEKIRDDIITAFHQINGVAYGSASETQKDAWLTDNTDRVLFGNAVGNRSGTDHSASLGAITASMKLGPDEVSLMKRIAESASPKIRPTRSTEDERHYVLYCGSLAFRDFSNNATITQANRDARARGVNNPLFQGGDLLWDGVIIKEIPDIASLGTVGASSAVVAPVFFCGAQAIGYAIAKTTKSVTETFDYDDKHGVAVEEIRGIGKMTFGSGSTDTADLKDHGIVTGYFAAAADA